MEIALPPGVAYWVQQVVNALPVSAVYAFLAVAYALVYGLVNRINLAFGEIAIVGGYASVATVLSFGTGLAAGPVGGVAAAVVVALGGALLHGSLVGATIGELVFKPLARANHRSFLIATIGLSIFLMEAMRLASGSRDRWIQPVLNDPIVLFGGSFEVTLTAMKALEIAGAVAVLAGLILLMTRSSFGREWRAVADDGLMARLLGVDAGRVAVLTFAYSSALAALAGGFGALHYGQATYGAGTMVGLKALGAALLGGIGSLPGAAAGGLVIGLVETMWSAGMPGEWRDVVILAVLILVLVFRPQGLFGVGRPEENAADTAGPTSADRASALEDDALATLAATLPVAAKWLKRRGFSERIDQHEIASAQLEAVHRAIGEAFLLRAHGARRQLFRGGDGDGAGHVAGCGPEPPGAAQRAGGRRVGAVARFRRRGRPDGAAPALMGGSATPGGLRPARVRRRREAHRAVPCRRPPRCRRLRDARQR